ncbi:MAG: hypothetical protein ACRD22_06180 [Terriglobia bacterium]
MKFFLDTANLDEIRAAAGKSIDGPFHRSRESGNRPSSFSTSRFGGYL